MELSIVETKQLKIERVVTHKSPTILVPWFSLRTVRSQKVNILSPHLQAYSQPPSNEAIAVVFISQRDATIKRLFLDGSYQLGLHEL